MSQSSGMTNTRAAENVTHVLAENKQWRGWGGGKCIQASCFPSNSKSEPNMVFPAHPERTKVIIFFSLSCARIKWIFPDKQADSSTSSSQKVKCSGLLLNIDLICKRPDAGLTKCHLLLFQFTFLVFWHFVSLHLPRAAHPLWPQPHTVNMPRFPSRNPAFFWLLLYLEASRTNVIIYINTQSKAEQ